MHITIPSGSLKSLIRSVLEAGLLLGVHSTVLLVNFLMISTGSPLTAFLKISMVCAFVGLLMGAWQTVCVYKQYEKLLGASGSIRCPASIA